MVKQEVLAALDAARGRYISGQELAAQLGVSRTAVWKAVAALRRDGIPIKAVTNRGYTLAQSVDVLNAAAVAAQLDEATVKALQIEVVDRLPGTNAALRSRADAGAREGLVLIAQAQSAGRGRGGHSFYSPPGGLYMSILLRPEIGARQAVGLTAMAAVAAARAAERLCGVPITIKWVNDLWKNGKKVCGILTEAALDLESGMLDYAVLGLGFNVAAPADGWPEDLRDVAGALYLPTIVADMINIGVAGGDLDFILRKGGLMLGVALVSGGGTLMGCFLCARLSARIGRDMRNALYDKSLTFSASDFEGFGTGSMITRTLNDVNVVQQAFVWSVQMVLPVPLMCVIGVLMAFSIDHVMGLLLIGITLVVILGAVLVTRRASAIFARAQRFLDRISVVVRENITGARVIRAFNKATGEAGRMRRSFTDYAQAAIQANTLFFVLESLAIFFLNLCVVAILWLGGNRIGGGFMEIGDITALT